MSFVTACAPREIEFCRANKPDTYSDEAINNMTHDDLLGYKVKLDTYLKYCK